MDEAAQDVAAWIDAGIVGYIGHSSSLKVVVEAVEAELKREPVLRSSPAALAGNAGIVPNRLASAGDGITPILTAREEEVVWLIIDGQSNKEIARSLDISVATVKSHVHNLLAKLGLQRRGMLALRYERRQSAVGGTRSADWVVETVARDASVLRPALLRPGGTPDRKRSIGGYHVKQKGRPDQQPLPPIELSTSLPTAVFETSDQRMGRQ
jgi:DNA-binding CsgD family transcriptional regulator